MSMISSSMFFLLRRRGILYTKLRIAIWQYLRRVTKLSKTWTCIGRHRQPLKDLLSSLPKVPRIHSREPSKPWPWRMQRKKWKVKEVFWLWNSWIFWRCKNFQPFGGSFYGEFWRNILHTKGRYRFMTFHGDVNFFMCLKNLRKMFPDSVSWQKIESQSQIQSTQRLYVYKVGPLLVICGVITPISRVITPVSHL